MFQIMQLRAACLALVLAVAAVATVNADHIRLTSCSDADILNFALNLEYLEAEFYSWAAYGKGLDKSLRGKGPASIGGKKANLTADAQAYAEKIADDEIAHVKLLRSVLGKRAVDMPLIDIGPAFAAAANAAFGKTVSPAFDPYANDLFFYHGAFVFEDVGVTAYKGAAPLVTQKDILSAAAGLLGTEAYHGGAIRAILGEFKDTNTPYGVTVKDIIKAISDLRDKADGPGDLDQPLVDDKGRVILAPGDANKISFGRTVAQVLKIVTLGGKDNKGGFFPEGLNGYLS